MENLVEEARASFKIVLQGWTGQAYFQMITDQASVLVTAGRCFGIKSPPVVHIPTWLLTLNMQDFQDMPTMKGNTKVCLLKHEYACETMHSLLPLKPVKNTKNSYFCKKYKSLCPGAGRNQSPCHDGLKPHGSNSCWIILKNDATGEN